MSEKGTKWGPGGEPSHPCEGRRGRREAGQAGLQTVVQRTSVT